MWKWFFNLQGIGTAAILLSAGNAWPAATLPLEKTLGFYSVSAPIPFNNSNAMMIQMPPGKFRAYRAQGFSGPVIEPGDDVYQAAMTADDSAILFSTPAALVSIRVSDGAELHRLPNTKDWSTFEFSTTGKYLLVHASYPDSIDVIRTSDFAVVHSEDGEYRGPSFAVDETNNIVYQLNYDSTEIYASNLGQHNPSLVTFPRQGMETSVLRFAGGAPSAVSGTVSFSAPNPPIIDSTHSFYYERNGIPPTQIWTGGYTTTSFAGGGAPRGSTFNGNVSADGSHLLSSRTGNVSDYKNGSLISSTANVFRANMSIDGSRVAYSINAASGQQSYTLKLEGQTVLNKTSDALFPAALNGPDDTFLAAVLAELPRTYDDQGHVVGTLNCFSEQPNDCGWRQFAGWIPGTDYVMADGYSLEIWNNATGERLQTLFESADAHDVEVLGASRDGSKILFFKECSGCTRFYDLEMRETTTILDGFETGGLTIAESDDGYRFSTAILSPDGQSIYAVRYHDAPGAGSDLLVRYSAVDGSIIDSEMISRASLSAPSYRLEFDSAGDVIVAVYISEFSSATPRGGITVHSATDLAIVRRLSSTATGFVSRQQKQLIVAEQTDKFSVIDARDGRELAEIPIFQPRRSQPLDEVAFIDGGNALLVPDAGVMNIYDITPLYIEPHISHFVHGAEDANPFDNSDDGIFDAADLVILP